MVTRSGLPRSRQPAAMLLLLAIAACFSTLAIWWRTADPGRDETLEGLSSRSLVRVLGEAFEVTIVNPEEIDDRTARQRFSDLSMNSDTRVMIMTWYRTGDDCPTKLRTIVWLYDAHGDWV